MSDIVERLRSLDAHDAPTFATDYMKEAADEIERLRFELVAAQPLYSRRKLEEDNERLRADIEKLKDPNVVHLGMLSGGIAKPNWKQIEHLYPEEIERLRGQVGTASNIMKRVTEIPHFKNQTIEALVRDARDWLAVTSTEQQG